MLNMLNIVSVIPSLFIYNMQYGLECREQRGEKLHWQLYEWMRLSLVGDRRIARKTMLLLNVSNSYSAIKSSAILVIVC